GDRAVVRLPILGERERLVAALEERYAHELLERLDLAAHRGLREEELGCRAREGEMARGRLEAAQQVERREAAGGVKHESSSCIACVFLVCSPTAARGSWAPWGAILACAPGMDKENKWI